MDLNTFKEYLKLHILSLEQDLAHEDGADSICSYLEGSIDVSNHYLEVLNER